MPSAVGIRARRRLALASARATSRVSRLVGLGGGTAMGGRVGLLVYPSLISDIAEQMHVVVVSATNGKSTTAAMLAACLRTSGSVAFNAGGSNMVEGVGMALAEAPHADFAVLELDEMVLDTVTVAARPDVIVLMNLSREYTRGVSLTTTMTRWADALAGTGGTTRVLANADDPLVVHAVGPVDNDRVHWLAAGCLWRRDALACPQCLGPIHWADDDWSCTVCTLRRPSSTWTLDGTLVRGPSEAAQVTTSIPGRWLGANAAFAMVAARLMDVPLQQSAGAIERVSDVDGRYQPIEVEGRTIRLYLVKNPAGWVEALSLGLEPGSSIVLAMETFSVRDMTPPWDVDLTGLRQARVVVTGQRRLDIAVLLELDGVPHAVVEEPIDAIRSMPVGPVSVIANFTAFMDLRERLAR